MVDIDSDFLCALAREAGSHALDMAENLHAELKPDQTFVTRVDREIERFLYEQLKNRYPHFAFLGEETGWHGSADGPLWAVDPIDGTTNMVYNIPIWGVSIALLLDGEPVAGVFYIPRLDELFYAQLGQGSYCNGIRLHSPDRTVLHLEDTIGFTSAAAKNLRTKALHGRIRCLGSIAADIAYVGRGSLACLVGWSEGAYDMAAALLVAKEAGCVARYFSGQPVELKPLLTQGKTREPFIIAPPNTYELVRAELAIDNLQDSKEV
ncbi:inositol monophosphatase family protein [Chthonomonas calidirosea]|uniref:inositol monophosphatase family protein n=1 Tax=Chthonomonas calidirosea TaxID=454171 RepID=UPI0006ECA909|nr:inositol monophosphatase family protein [Chthonomonas calidirosea]CEK14426.1 inositol monophosphatase/fructose-1,6-bisphosphatase family protein [Chthonomonas calidirosea]